MLKISWPHSNAKQFVDHIPTNLFKTETKRKNLSHPILGPKLQRLTAYFDLSVTGNSAEFDYQPYCRENKASVDPGKMLITFSNKKRTLPIEAVWKAKGKGDELGKIHLADDDVAALEGNKKLAVHLRSERRPILAIRKKEEALTKFGRLVCEGCRMDLSQAYKGLGLACCEVHHLTPIAHEARRTILSELAILCANCHRVLHKMNPLPDNMKKFRDRVRD